MIEIGPNLLKAVDEVSVCAFLAVFAYGMYKIIKDV
jgi:hypothetical protein